MEQGPLVSVIIPVYRRRELIIRTLDSVCSSSYPHLEVLVAEDGSQDGTLEAIQEAAGKDPRIQVIPLKHGGVSAARNAALDRAKGDYVFFMDSDDMIHPELILKELEVLREGKADFIICDMLRRPDGQYVTWVRDSRPRLKFMDAGEARRTFFLKPDLLTRVSGMMASIQAIHSERFDTDLTCSEDTLFTYHLIRQNRRWCHLEKSWYYYHHSKTSLTNTPSMENFESVSTAMERILSMERACGTLADCRVLLGWTPYYLVRSALTDMGNPLWKEKIRAWIREKKDKGLYREIPLKNRLCLYLAQSSSLSQRALKMAIRSKEAVSGLFRSC